MWRRMNGGQQVRIALVVVVLWIGGCGGVPQAGGKGTNLSQGGQMKITSPAFAEGEMIPKQYTCDGKNVSPPLAWSDVPADVKSFAMIMDDPDASAGTWVHWVLFNLPAGQRSLSEGVLAVKTLPGGGVQGTSSFRKYGYGGPCPPGGTHRYFFKLYALDGLLSLSNNATAKDLETAIRGRIVAETQLMGRYKR